MIDVFLGFLEREKGQKPNTIRNNKKIINKILTDCSPLNQATASLFVENLIRNEFAPSYIRQQVCIIRQWGECFNIPELQNIHCPKIRHSSSFERETFSDEEVIRFITLPSPFKKKSYFTKRYEMWIMFFSILFYHGMRTGEIARLTVDMIDFGLGVINLPAHITKIKTARRVPISPALDKKLYEYVQALDGEYLFPSHRALPYVGQAAWNDFFKKQVKRLGIKRKNLTPYSGRHTYGTRQAEEDVHLSKIKAIMGHKKITTTEKYIHLGLKSLKKVQNSDRLLDYDKTSKQTLQDIYQLLRGIEDTYGKKIYSQIQISENGRELSVKFKARKL